VIARIIAMAEMGPKLFKHDRESVIEPLAILKLVHADVFESVCRRIRSFGCTPLDSKIKHAAATLSDRVERACMPADDWIYDPRSNIEADNPDSRQVDRGRTAYRMRRVGPNLVRPNEPPPAQELQTHSIGRERGCHPVT
jgi:hypothetical protein